MGKGAELKNQNHLQKYKELQGDLDRRKDKELRKVKVLGKESSKQTDVGGKVECKRCTRKVYLSHFTLKIGFFFFPVE